MNWTNDVLVVMISLAIYFAVRDSVKKSNKAIDLLASSLDKKKTEHTEEINEIMYFLKRLLGNQFLYSYEVYADTWTLYIHRPEENTDLGFMMENYSYDTSRIKEEIFESVLTFTYFKGAKLFPRPE
jgi:hypothetical protein